MNIVNWFLGNPFALVMLSLAAGAAGIALIAWAYPILKNNKQNYPYESEIEAALLPYLLKAVVIAYKMSETALDETGERLRGLDKKVIANTLYDMLPPTIGGFPVDWIKSIISKEKFAEMVQGAFNRAMDLYELNQDEFERVYQEWLAANGGLLLGGNKHSRY